MNRLPEQVNTLSKRACVHTISHPRLFVKGKGCKAWDADGKEYIDWPCSLGANLLGHAYPSVVEAIKSQAEEGTLFSLEHPKVGELAELIHDTIPSMEAMRFLKTGSEACSAAVRIARDYTGRWPVIVCGYHGWHEWYNCTTPKNAGSVTQDVTSVKWGDFAGLKRLVDEKKPAAYMLEPYIYRDEDTCKKYLQQVRKLCSANDVVLIFDENVTGFRSRKITAQETVKVRPDLTCLGKAMANGVPMACVGGKKEIMDVLKADCFVSSTYGGELLGISAALATLKVLKEEPVYHHLEMMGQKLRVAFNNSATSFSRHDTTECIGQPQRTFFKFPTAEHKGAFWQYCVERGIFFGFAQFVTFSHDQTSVERTTATVREAMYALNKYWDRPQEMLKGPAPQETLRTIVLPEKKPKAAKEPEQPRGAEQKAAFDNAQEIRPDSPKRKRGRPKGSKNKK
ncbi:MAG TPA: aminotransferase class III-fold pyridoxal phosphate-dependent enzyme [Planctomycetes bacterium]|nr:aminotransferase class III-fold pyridoxal phosphate-dependent enzyme [Planctomycetota bacterium]